MSIEYNSPYEDTADFVDSYATFERAAGYDDEGWIDTTLFQGNEEYPRYNLTPEEAFHVDVQKILRFGDFDLNSQDKRTIVGAENKMNWTKFQIPEIFILGYYVHKHNMSEKSIEYTEQFIKPGQDFEVIKLARYWKYILDLNEN